MNEFNGYRVNNLEPTPVKEKKKKSRFGFVLGISVLSFACGMFGAYFMCNHFNVANVAKNMTTIVKNITTSELIENSISSSVDKVYGSTVAITAYADGKGISTGTGFIYKKADGLAYIITNNHVIDGADTTKIEFNDSDKQIEANIVGGDKYADIAVLTIDDSDEYKTVSIGDNEVLKLGDTIFTVGTPMGTDYKGTITKGILSGKDRMVQVNVSGNVADYYMKVIQLDAAVNPGNSGGPLCDVSGNVIGVISLKIVQDTVEGMGFAIPIEDALKYAELIEDGGTITRPYIGISMVDITETQFLMQNEIEVPEEVEDGVVIASVEEDGPADKAGLKKGDIVLKINSGNTRNIAEFRYELYKYEVGQKIEVTIYRDGKKEKLTVVLGKNPS